MKKQLTVQLQSRPFSRKAKTAAQSAKIVQENKAAWEAELAMLQKKAAAYEAAHNPETAAATPSTTRLSFKNLPTYNRG